MAHITAHASQSEPQERTEKSPVREVGERERERERKRNKNKTPLRVEANLFFGARPCEISQPFLNANVDAGPVYALYHPPLAR